MILSLLRLVGITGLEPATSRPPDVCATNCAKSRSFYSLATDLMVHLRVQSYKVFMIRASIFVVFSQKSCFYRRKNDSENIENHESNENLSDYLPTDYTDDTDLFLTQIPTNFHKYFCPDNSKELRNRRNTYET